MTNKLGYWVFCICVGFFAEGRFLGINFSLYKIGVIVASGELV